MEAGHGCMEKGILLEYREIFLLLESIGAESVNGICLDQKPVSDEEAVRVLAGMNRKGFLEDEGGVFRIEKRTGRMLQCMAWPEQDYPMVIEDETYYCYERGREVLVTSLCRTRQRTLELLLFGREEFERWKEEMRDDTCGY